MEAQTYFSGLPKLSKAFRSALLDAHTNDTSQSLACVDFKALRSLFEPWNLDEQPSVRKLSHKEKDRIARALPGRPGNSYNKKQRKQHASPKTTSTASVAVASAAVVVPALGSVFSSEGSLALPSTGPTGTKRPREGTDVASSVAAALARGDVGAAKRAVHTAAAQRSATAGHNMAAGISSTPQGGWDAAGVYHASNGVHLERGDEPCVYHAMGKCQHAAQPGSICTYSHALGRFPCMHAHTQAVQYVQEQLDAGVLHLEPPPALGALRPSIGGCRRGAARCPFSHDALSPLGYAMLERDVVQRHRRAVASQGAQGSAPPAEGGAVAAAGGGHAGGGSGQGGQPAT